MLPILIFYYFADGVVTDTNVADGVAANDVAGASDAVGDVVGGRGC